LKNDTIHRTIEDAKKAIEEDRTLSASMRMLFNVLFLIIQALCHKLNINSLNSSKAPSLDPKRQKPNRGKSGKKPGGQEGRTFATLQPVESPDVIENIKVDRTLYPGKRPFFP